MLVPDQYLSALDHALCVIFFILMLYLLILLKNYFHKIVNIRIGCIFKLEYL